MFVLKSLIVMDRCIEERLMFTRDSNVQQQIPGVVPKYFTPKQPPC
jgi:hypothetical protein